MEVHHTLPGGVCGGLSCTAQESVWRSIMHCPGVCGGPSCTVQGSAGAPSCTAWGNMWRSIMHSPGKCVKVHHALPRRVLELHHAVPGGARGDPSCTAPTKPSPFLSRRAPKTAPPKAKPRVSACNLPPSCHLRSHVHRLRHVSPWRT